MSSSKYIQIVVRKKDGTINSMCHYPSYVMQWFDKAEFYIDDSWLSEWDSTYLTVIDDLKQNQYTGKYDFILTEKYIQTIGCEPIDSGIIIIDYQTKTIFSSQLSFEIGKRKISYVDSNYSHYRYFFEAGLIQSLSYYDKDMEVIKTIDISHNTLSDIRHFMDCVRGGKTEPIPIILQDVSPTYHSSLYFNIHSQWQIHDYKLHAKSIMKIRKFLEHENFIINPEENIKWKEYIDSISSSNIKNDISDIEFMYDYYNFFKQPFIFS